MTRLLLAGALGVFTAVVVAVIAAIVLAVADLYLSGHQLAEIRQPLGETLALSLADIVLLLASVGAGGAVSYAIWRARRN